MTDAPIPTITAPIPAAPIPTITVKDAENVGHSVLKRLILWIEKEAHLAGVNIETEIASILAKLHIKK